MPAPMGTPTHYVELHLATLNSSLPASPHPWPLSAPYFPVSFCMFSLQIPHLDLPALPPGPPAALPAQGAGLSPGPGGDTRSPGAAFKSHAPTVSLPFLLSLGDTQAWLSPPPQAGLGSLLLVQEAWVPVPCAHLAELYLHEHVMLPPTAALRAPRVLGPVVARTAGWGAPVARQASSCPRKKRWGDPSSQWTPFLASDQQLRACKARHLFPAQPLPPSSAVPCTLWLPVAGMGAEVLASIEVPDQGELAQHHTAAGHGEVGRCSQQVRAAQRP